MSLQSQKKLMKEIAGLLSQDLGYIFGERESGPNGVKKQFLTKSAAFLRALGKDLGFSEMKVNTNKAGIAVSGDVTLYGMWGEGNGVYFVLTEPLQPFNSLLYRSISHIKDHRGGNNQWIGLEVFADQNYGRLCSTLLKLKRTEVSHDIARAA